MPQSAYLIDSKTNEVLAEGMTSLTFRGETVFIDGLLPFEGMAGRVRCIDSDGFTNWWYPSVIGAEFVYSDV